MAFTQDDLNLADEQLAQAEALVSQQRARVDELHRAGLPIEPAQQLLVLLLELRHQLGKHRNIVADALSNRPNDES